MDRHNDAGADSVTLSFLVGAMVGAAVALLYAPATGRQAREFLGEKARESRGRAAEAAVKGREAVKRGREAVERGREAYEHARSLGDSLARGRMSLWAEVFLGVIAITTLAMAIGLVGMLLTASRLARRAGRLLDQLESELKPLFGHLDAMGHDASRAAALATAQVERVDHLVVDLGQRLDQTLQRFQATFAGPARESLAFVGAVSAAIRAIREARVGRARAEDEDGLFI